MGQHDTFGKAFAPPVIDNDETNRRILPDDFAHRMGEKIYKSRRLRDEMFAGLDLFGEPAWDILLDAWNAERSGRQTSVSSACLAAAVPASTALRKVTMLESQGLIERTGDPADRRRSFLRLTDLGQERMRAYFESLALMR